MKEKIDLVTLPKKSFWKLSIPIIAFCIFDTIYSIVDLIWISKISIEAFFAMGVSIPIVSLIFSFGDSIGQGTNSIMSRFIGSGDYESAYNSLIHGMIISNVVWVILIFCLLFAYRIIYFLNKQLTYILVFDYLFPIIIFAYIFIFINLFAETLQAEGNSHVPTMLIIGSNVLNIILDPIFIFNLNLGIKGAAYATVLSAFIVLIIFMYLYLFGKTKVPLAARYFKLRKYIFIEILKVALPNFLDNGLWCFLASFVNATLLTSMGPIGPILYSVSNKLKSLFISPTRGYGRALMSVTGHLFGARKFDDLNEMFKYTLKISFITTLAEMIVFVLLRDYIFSLFSIIGMQTEVFWIAIGGTFIMLSIPFSMISAKMLDGFGKSMYSLLFTIFKIVLEILLILGLKMVLSGGPSVLCAILISEIISAIVYSLFLRYLFKNFDKKYEGKETVKILTSEESLKDSETEPDDNELQHKYRHRLPLILALITMIITVLRIISLPFKEHNYSLMISGTIALITGAFSIYAMERLNKPKVSVIGFISCAIILFIFMGEHGYLATLLYIITGVLIIYIKIITKKLEKEK